MRAPILLASALLIAACSGEDKQPGEACGPNDKCVSGYTCDPKTMTCQRIAVGIDGGGAVADGSVDAKPVPDGNLADGPAVADARIADARVFDAPGSDAIIDTTAPVVTLGVRATDCASEAITFTVDDATAVYTCTLDSTVTTPCTSPFMLPADIGGGPHMFAVHGTDAANNVGADATLTFNIDRTGPIVLITGTIPPPDTDGFSDASGIIAFTTDGTAVSVTCQLDAILPAADCTPTSGSAGSIMYSDLMDIDNPHTLTVVALDSCGNPNAEPAVLSFNVDSTGPTICVTALDSLNGLSTDPGCTGGQDAVSGPNGDIIFSAEETGTYTCALDGGFADPCRPGEPVTFDGLTAGEHMMTIDGRDTHNNPATLLFTWNVDNVGPTFTITQIRTTDNTGVVTIDYTASEPVSRVTCQMDGVNCSMCSSVQAVCTDLSAGFHIFTVQGIDRFGNTGPVTTSQLIQVVFGPNEGHAIVIGHDFPIADANTTAVLQQAAEQVPYLHQFAQGGQPPLFNRGIRVVAYHQPTASSTEVANAQAALFADPIVDQSFYHEFANATDLLNQLLGADVLLVYDQQDPANIASVGRLWYFALAAFLNDGGIVIVLDGFTTYPMATTPSQTNLVIGVTPPNIEASPIFALSNPRRLNANRHELLLTRLDDLNDDVNGDFSPIAVPGLPEYVSPVNATVIYQEVNDQFGPRQVYVRICPNCSIIQAPTLAALLEPVTQLIISGTAVADKIFPVYSFSASSATIGPQGPLEYFTNLDPAAFTRIDCTVTNIFCPAGSAGCKTGICKDAICPCGGDQTNGFTMPFIGSGDYEVDMRVIDVWDRPARGSDVKVTIDLPAVFVANPPANLDARGPSVICVNTVDDRTISSVTLTVNSATTTATAQGTVDTRCSVQGFLHSYLSTTWTSTCGITNAMFATATDSFNNAGTSNTYNWTGPACPPR